MKTFRITFHNGQVQELQARHWTKIDHTIVFDVHPAAPVHFPASELLMIDEISSGAA